MSAVSYKLLLLTHVSGTAWSYPCYKLSTIGSAGRETISAELLFKGYFRFSGHCFAVVFFPSNIKIHCHFARLLFCQAQSVKQKFIVPLQRLCLKCIQMLWVFSRNKPLGFSLFLAFFFCEWDVTKKRIPLSTVPNLDMPCPGYELYLPLTIASCTVFYPLPLFMAEIFKASKAFRLTTQFQLSLILGILQFLWSVFYLPCGNIVGHQRERMSSFA